MHQELPTLTGPARHRVAVPKQTGKHWAPVDLRLLGRLAGGLRHSLARFRGDCRFTDPIRGRSHAFHVMDIHRGHSCGRYSMAADYLVEARP